MWNKAAHRPAESVSRTSPNTHCTQESGHRASPRVCLKLPCFLDCALPKLTTYLFSWTRINVSHITHDRAAALEFKLHQSHYLQLLLSSSDPQIALSYARTYFPPLYASHGPQINRLLTCLAYISRIQESPFADLASPDFARADLVAVFMKEYCAVVGLSRQVPLRVVGDIAGGGALARIEKGRRIMKDRKSEWSQADELPVCCLLVIVWS